MRPLLVVGDEPTLGQGADLPERLEEIRIEHLGAITTVESFDEGVLIRLTRLDVVQRDPALVTPVLSEYRAAANLESPHVRL